MWVGRIQSAGGLSRTNGQPPPRKKEFCQQIAFGLKLQLFPESLVAGLLHQNSELAKLLQLHEIIP